MLCLSQYRPALFRFWFQIDLRRKNSASFFTIQAGRLFLTMVTCWSRSTSNVYALIGSNLTGEFKRKICAASWKWFTFDSWSWQSFESTCDVFNCLFPLNVQNEIQLLSRVFSYSWLVCLLGFCWEMCRLSKPIIRFRRASLLFFTLLDACENYKGSSDPCLSEIAKLLYLYLISWSRAQFMKLVYARLY